jgi:mannose-1-phosphate guanylyltransferase
MYAVIMAGGKGARFWPRSRNRLPKHLLDICNERTIIQETVERIIPLTPPEKILIVTGASHARELIGQLPQIPPENILIEPVGRNTAPCIGLAALVVRKRAGNAVMAVLPSDHLIADEEHFRHVLAAAADMAARGDHLVTIGIRPTGPETGYGYIEEGKLATRERGEDIFTVKSIREKPDAELAKTFLARGGFYWNSGMFIWQAATILKEMEASLPDIYEGLLTIDKALGTPAEAKIIADAYGRFRSISIDYGVMETSKNTLVIPTDFGWSDVGSWDALWEVSEKDDQGIAARNREGLISVNSRNSLVYSPKKLVALVEVTDLIVVETEDALLICKRGASQEVKKVVETLEEEKREEYL